MNQHRRRQLGEVLKVRHFCVEHGRVVHRALADRPRDGLRLFVDGQDMPPSLDQLPRLVSGAAAQVYGVTRVLMFDVINCATEQR
ncbi:hypothetical protein D3C75_1199830 [compost metagenome]